MYVCVFMKLKLQFNFEIKTTKNSLSLHTFATMPIIKSMYVCMYVCMCVPLKSLFSMYSIWEVMVEICLVTFTTSSSRARCSFTAVSCVCMYVGMYVCRWVGISVCMMYVCMYVRTVCTYVYHMNCARRYIFAFVVVWMKNECMYA